MPLYLPEPKGFELPPAGTYAAICYRVIDLGTQKRVFEDHEEYARLIQIGWELPTEKMSDGRPFVVGKIYRFSTSSRSNLRQDLEAWRGRQFSDADFGPGGFSLDRLLDAKCTLTIKITQNAKGENAQISGIGPLMKGTQLPPRHNPLQLLILEEGEFDPEVYASLHEKMQKWIAESPEYQKVKNGGTKSSTRYELDDEIPF